MIFLGGCRIVAVFTLTDRELFAVKSFGLVSYSVSLMKILIIEVHYRSDHSIVVTIVPPSEQRVGWEGHD